MGLLSRPTAFPPGDLAARDAASGATEGGAESLLRLTVACIALVAVAGYVATYTHYLDIHAYPVIRSDGVGYYSYLPAWFIEHDATLRTFVALGHAGPRPDWVGLQQLSNGNYLNRYQIGEAVMLLPFFFAGHGIALLAGLNAGGFSGPEQLATGLGGLVYMVAGLAVLGRALRRRFSAVATAATLVAITFGSNLFHYGTFDSMFSHAVSFFLVACLLETTRWWYARHGVIAPSLVLGLNIGLIALVRLPNVIFVLVPLLYGITDASSVRARLRWFGQVRWGVLVAVVVAIAMYLPQLVAWRLATGSWIVYSYGSAGFDLAHPQILPTLFSFDPHGFLPWAPVMVLALAGIALLRRAAPELLWPVVVTVVVFVFLVASWTFNGPEWFFGGGYGDRAFIDVFPLLAFGLAALFADARRGVPRWSVALATAACCLLATDQMLHYWRLIVPFGGVSFSDYLHLLSQRFW